MCDSCLGVMKQFKNKYPNVTVNVVSNKKKEPKNHNKPWRIENKGSEDNESRPRVDISGL